MPIISNASLKQQTSGGNTGRCREKMCVCVRGGGGTEEDRADGVWGRNRGIIVYI